MGACFGAQSVILECHSLGKGQEQKREAQSLLLGGRSQKQRERRARRVVVGGRKRVPDMSWCRQRRAKSGKDKRRTCQPGEATCSCSYSETWGTTTCAPLLILRIRLRG